MSKVCCRTGDVIEEEGDSISVSSSPSSWQLVPLDTPSPVRELVVERKPIKWWG